MKKIVVSIAVIALFILGNTFAFAQNTPTVEEQECLNALKRLDTDKYKKVKVAIHQEEADRIANNEKHVFYAYGAFMSLLIVFILILWRRQQRLLIEIDRLEEEVRLACAEE